MTECIESHPTSK